MGSVIFDIIFGGTMIMAYNTPQRIAELSIEAGKRKVNLPLSTLLALGFFYPVPLSQWDFFYWTSV